MAAGREPTPSLGGADGQTVTGTSVGDPRTSTAARRPEGRKRRVLADILGLLVALVVTVASLEDRDLLPTLSREGQARSARLTRALVDSIYDGDVVEAAARETGIGGEVVNGTGNEPGFKVLPIRWIVERTSGSLQHRRLLTRGYERTTARDGAGTRLTFIRPMARLAA